VQLSWIFDPGAVVFPAGKGVSSMTWFKIAEVVKRLDNHLSDAAYLHGCYLTGQEKIVGYHAQVEAEDHSHVGAAQRQARMEIPTYKWSARWISLQCS
jgi:hypothetical protein